MTQETTTTNNPYPTIEEKVKLFKENGIEVIDYFESERTGYSAVSQVIAFEGPADAGAAAKVAKEHGIKIRELCMTWPYTDENEPDYETYSGLTFSNSTI